MTNGEEGDLILGPMFSTSTAVIISHDNENDTYSQILILRLHWYDAILRVSSKQPIERAPIEPAQKIRLSLDLAPEPGPKLTCNCVCGYT